MSSFYFVTVAPCAAMNSSGIFRTVSDGFLYDVKITERTGGSQSLKLRMTREILRRAHSVNPMLSRSDHIL